ncbi:hypothetical protein [Croceicoccus sp. Ery5]|uniref:hypothetical protein n=1 Tax=Croceicoccus sp. Ery5 TaxID=1703340 RepID=UPI001E455611|nr:hypothetical protein [Croceicoccus sp. Ery5]
MATVRSLDIFDVARSLGQRPFAATPESVADWIMANYQGSKGGGFNYDTSIEAVYDAFRGGHTTESAINHCLVNGNPKGRTQNASAIKAVMPYILEHQSRCYRTGLTAVAVGRYSARTVFAKIKAPLIRVEGDQAFMVVPGFRMSHRPRDIEIDFACSVALEVLSEGNYAAADFEYLYAGPGPKLSGRKQARMFQAVHGCDRHRFDVDTINRLLDVYVNGVALAAERGADTREPDLRGYRIIDPSQPSMF